jgi:hypothetical protein
MYTVSFYAQLSFRLDIHNKCSNFDLVSPKYVTGDELECYDSPGDVYAGATRERFFIIKSDNESYGVIVYKIRRKQKHESTKTSENTSSAVYLLVVWENSESKKLCADVLLIEYDKGFDWHKNNLNRLYYVNHGRLKECNGAISNTWLMNSDMALKTLFKVKGPRRSPELSISISEEKIDNYAMRPFCIHPKR